MSYLDFPRIHFGGMFEAGPSTVNNTPSNYDLGNPDVDPGWNPGGSAYFKLRGCTVRSVVADVSGPDTTADLVGTAVASTDDWGNSGVPAKIVDLDPEQQQVSTIYGLQIRIGAGENAVTAEMDPMWFQNYQGAATYQSVLRPVQPHGWGAKLSGTLRALHDLSPELLSIKFMLGPITGLPDNAPVVAGIVGTIGPGDADEPINFVPARRLSPTRTGGQQGLNYSPALVTLDERKSPRRLTIDLGSGIAPAQPETLTVSVVDPKHGSIVIGTVEYGQAAMQQCALVKDFDVSGLRPFEAGLLTTRPLQVSGPAPLLQEDPSGLYVDACPYVLRLEAGATATVDFRATRFGAPADGVDIDVFQQEGLLPRGLPSHPVPPTVGEPGAGGTGLSVNGTLLGKSAGVATLTSANGGRAQAVIDGGDPMRAREHIDGQVYGMWFLARGQDKELADPNAFLSVLVHDAFDEPATWESIEPFMSQYARLYPVMKDRFGIDLGCETSMQKHRNALLEVFARPIEDPRYMPVVRDLSDAKRNTVVAWLLSLS